MGIVVYSLSWVRQDLYYQPYGWESANVCPMLLGHAIRCLPELSGVRQSVRVSSFFQESRKHWVCVSAPKGVRNVRDISTVISGEVKWQAWP